MAKKTSESAPTIESSPPTLRQELVRIQQTVKAPKGKYNAFGKFKYRSCEDIIEALKPLLGACTVVLDDELIMVGDRYYIKAKAVLAYGSETLSAHGYGREQKEKKGMDEAQITGSASSYARKYALNGLFLIDDGDEIDAKDGEEKPKITEPKKPIGTPAETEIIELRKKIGEIVKAKPELKERLTELSKQASKNKKTKPSELDIAELKTMIVAMTFNAQITADKLPADANDILGYMPEFDEKGEEIMQF